MRCCSSGVGQSAASGAVPANTSSDDENRNRVSSWPWMLVVYTASVGWSPGSPARRIRSAMPSRRKYSIERALVVLHRGFPVVCRLCSRTTTGTPREHRSSARVMPTGPAPTTTTGEPA